MDDTSTSAPLGFAEAVQTVLRRSGPGSRIVELDIARAAGFAPAEEVFADVDLPPFDRAAMDGFAYRHADLARGPRLRLAGRVAAGETPAPRLAPGECVKIMTGAVVPEDADTVIPVEDTTGYQPRDGFVAFHRPPPRGANIAPRGEDLRAGAAVLRPGALLTAQDIGLLAAVGRRRVRVHDGPRIAFAATGSELREPGDPLPAGCIRNSNAYALWAQVLAARGHAEYLGLLPDEPDALRAALARGLAADILVVSGGISMGELDLVPGALEELGVRIVFRWVRVRPGRPTLFGVREREAAAGPGASARTLVFGLPGNPLSTLFGFDQYVLPAARVFRRHPRPAAPILEGRLDAGVRKKPGNTALIACRSEWAGSGFVLSPLVTHGSADIAGVRGADAIAIIPEEAESPGAGTRVPFRRLHQP